MSVFGVFLVRAEKYEPEKLRIRTLFNSVKKGESFILAQGEISFKSKVFRKKFFRIDCSLIPISVTKFLPISISQTVCGLDFVSAIVTNVVQKIASVVS